MSLLKRLNERFSDVEESKVFVKKKLSGKKKNTENLTKIAAIKDKCEEHDIKKYTINSDFTVDVDSYVHLNDQWRLEGKSIVDSLGFYFGTVKGFTMQSNRNIESLEGAPKKVEGSFNISNCDISDMEYAPKEVGGDFIFWDCNSLESLKGCPEKIGGKFYGGSHPRLKSLKGISKKIGGGFDLRRCHSLQFINDLNIAKVKGDFDLQDCTGLLSLEGIPDEVTGDVNLIGCKSLSSFDYAPEKVGGTFYCRGTTGVSVHKFNKFKDNVFYGVDKKRQF